MSEIKNNCHLSCAFVEIKSFCLRVEKRIVYWRLMLFTLLLLKRVSDALNQITELFKWIVIMYDFQMFWSA